LLQLRIRLSGATVKELHRRLRQAYTPGDVRLARRISVLLGYLAQGLALAGTEVFGDWVGHTATLAPAVALNPKGTIAILAAKEQ